MPGDLGLVRGLLAGDIERDDHGVAAGGADARVQVVGAGELREGALRRTAAVVGEAQRAVQVGGLVGGRELRLQQRYRPGRVADLERGPGAQQRRSDSLLLGHLHRGQSLEHGASLGDRAQLEQALAQGQPVVRLRRFQGDRRPEVGDALLGAARLEVRAAQQVVGDRVPRVGRLAGDVLLDLADGVLVIAAIVGGQPGLPVGSTRRGSDGDREGSERGQGPEVHVRRSLRLVLGCRLSRSPSKSTRCCPTSSCPCCGPPRLLLPAGYVQTRLPATACLGGVPCGATPPRSDPPWCDAPGCRVVKDGAQ